MRIVWRKEKKTKEKKSLETSSLVYAIRRHNGSLYPEEAWGCSQHSCFMVALPEQRSTSIFNSAVCCTACAPWGALHMHLLHIKLQMTCN